MGTIKNGILDGFSGTVGPVVGSSWKDIDVISSRPPRKRRRSTEGQLSQMARMELVSGFVAPLTNLLNKTYGGGLVKMSAFNKALSYNMRNAVDGDYPKFRINFARLILGSGDLLNPELSVTQSAVTGQLSFIWKDNSSVGSARSTDQAFAAVYCPELNQWKTGNG